MAYLDHHLYGEYLAFSWNVMSWAGSFRVVKIPTHAFGFEQKLSRERWKQHFHKHPNSEENLGTECRIRGNQLPCWHQPASSSKSASTMPIPPFNRSIFIAAEVPFPFLYTSDSFFARGMSSSKASFVRCQSDLLEEANSM